MQWTIGRLSLEVARKLVDSLDVSVEAVQNSAPGCQVMFQLMKDGPVFRTVSFAFLVQPSSCFLLRFQFASVLGRGIERLDEYSNFPGILFLRFNRRYLLC